MKPQQFLTRRRVLSAVALASALAISGCATSGAGKTTDSSKSAESSAAKSDTGSATSAAAGTASETASATNSGTAATGAATQGASDDFSSLGDVTLKVWADAGEEDTLKIAEKEFETAHPNVDVQTTVRGFDDYITIIANTLQGADAPDVAQGNQGYGVDGLLVESKLIIPIDDYAAKYGWTDRFSEGALQEFRWTSDGQFGSGDLYGVSPIAEFVGVYYNKEKLDQLGIALPKTFDEFQTALKTAKDGGERPIQLGNSEGWPGIQLFGLIQAAYTPPADVRNWIVGQKGQTFASETNTEAASVFQKWATDGYFGDDFNGVGNDDAVARFTEGDGVFFLGGTWNTGTLSEAMGDNVGFMAMPPGQTKAVGGTGSLGLGWHISAKSKNPDVAASFIALLNSREFATELAGLGRIPAQEYDGTATGVFADTVAANDALGGADGYTFYPDWATDTMFDTMSAGIQELLANQTKPDQFVTSVQDDWTKFHDSRSGG